MIEPEAAPGSPGRPIGNVRSFLEDVRARGLRPAGILDVGANQGSWTRMALEVFPDTPVMLIEPQDEMEAPLTALARELQNCSYCKAGAGARDGELIQTIWPDLAGSSFLPEVDSQRVANGTQRRTRIVTIDSLLAAAPEFKPDLVKLDIQGFELEALEGAQSVFGRTELFIIETSLFPFLPRQPITWEVVAYMAARDYEIYDITEFLRRAADGALAQVDLGFVKKDGMFRMHHRW